VTAAVDADLSTIGVPSCPEGPDERRPNSLAWMADRERIPVVAWELAVSCGVEPSSSYVETYWLPILGPSATWALRRISAWLATAPPSGLWLPVEPLARSLGLGSAAGRNCPMRRTLARLVDFRMAEIDEDRDVLAVRTVIPALADRQIARLPEHLIPHHDDDLRRDLRRFT
jgi:hypothetical protein